ncbi:MAG: ABC-2 family transporter protein [Promethearchaeota archaeon]
MGTKDVLRQLRLLPDYIRLSFLRVAENKIQIFGAFFSTSVNLAMYVLFWGVITYQIPILTGYGWVVWGQGELTFLIGMTEVAWGFGAFFWMGIWETHWYITEIGIETFQIRPAGSIYQILATSFWAGGLVQVGVGGVMLALSVLAFGLVVTPFSIVFGVIALLLGQAALYLLWACLCCLAFWIGRNEGLLEISDALEYNFARMPIDVMPVGVQYFLLFVFPVIFISTVPTMIMLNLLPLGPALIYLGIAGVLVILWLLVLRVVWSRGLRRYQPVGG